MLLNLTNHPSTVWDSYQLQTAKEQFGEVIDMPFPNIAPTSTEEDIDQLAQQYANTILERYNAKDLVVHLMGELCFSFALLKLLQGKGIRVVASTTERIVEEKENQQKIVSFRFVKFRDYS